MLLAAFHIITREAAEGPMADLAPIVRRPVEIEVDGIDQFQVVRKLPYGSDGLTLLQHKSSGAL
jgi:hypothetical protein